MYVHHANLVDKRIKTDSTVQELAAVEECAMNPELWRRTPRDVAQWLLLDALVNIHRRVEIGTISKRTISRLSLTCRCWARRLRPFLFADLALASAEDLSFLGRVLSSPVSEWLGMHVLNVRFYYTEVKSGKEGRLWRSLPLPALSTLILCLGDDDEADQPEGSVFNAISQFSFISRSSCHHMHTLQSLTIENFRFHSFSTFLRDLGTLPNLQRLSLEAISWTVQPTPERLGFPSFKGILFPALKSLEVDNVDGGLEASEATSRPKAWVFSIILASSSLKHTFLRSYPPEFESSTHRDVLNIVDILRHIQWELGEVPLSMEAWAGNGEGKLHCVTA